jgi:hypothetical protein
MPLNFNNNDNDDNNNNNDIMKYVLASLVN